MHATLYDDKYYGEKTSTKGKRNCWQESSDFAILNEVDKDLLEKAIIENHLKEMRERAMKIFWATAFQAERKASTMLLRWMYI